MKAHKIVIKFRNIVQVFDYGLNGVRDAVLTFNSKAPLMRLLSAVAFSAMLLILNCQYGFIIAGVFLGFLDRSLSPTAFFSSQRFLHFLTVFVKCVIIHCDGISFDVNFAYYILPNRYGCGKGDTISLLCIIKINFTLYKLSKIHYNTKILGYR